jgi:hypothetical protein
MRIGVDAKADSTHTDRLQFRERSGVLRADQDVDRLGGDRPDDCANRFVVREIRRVENVSSCLRVGGQAANGVIDVGNVPQKVVRTAGQDDLPARNRGSRLDATDRVIEFTNRRGGVTGGVLDANPGQTVSNGRVDGGTDVFVP